jgi:hypothetical protein
MTPDESWAATQTPEFRKQLREDAAESNRGITHEEFTAGVRNHTMGFKCMSGEPCTLLRGRRLLAFDTIVLLYQFGPFIIVPLWAWHEHNWWLLIGIVISRLGTKAAPWFMPGLISSRWSGKRGAAVFFLFVTTAILWIWVGGHSSLTFLSISAMWGFLLFHMAEDYQNQAAIRSLLDTPELFNSAAGQGRIRIVTAESDAADRAKFGDMLDEEKNGP